MARAIRRSGPPSTNRTQQDRFSRTSSSRQDADLLQESLATLGETDPTTFLGVLDHYSVKHIRTVLDRVRATPPEKFRNVLIALNPNRSVGVAGDCRGVGS